MLARRSATADLKATAAYIMEKEGAEVVDGNVAGRSPEMVALQMKRVTRHRRQLKHQGEHFSINFEPGTELTDDRAREAVRVFLKCRGIDTDNHQYVAVRHTDADHPHIHILVNRAGYDGDFLSSDWTKREAVRAAKEASEALEWDNPVEVRRGLHFDKGELELMAAEQEPTKKLAVWASKTGHDEAIADWDDGDWQRFSQHPGVVLSEIERERDRHASSEFRVQSSELDLHNSLTPSVTIAEPSPTLNSELTTLNSEVQQFVEELAPQLRETMNKAGYNGIPLFRVDGEDPVLEGEVLEARFHRQTQTLTLTEKASGTVKLRARLDGDRWQDVGSTLSREECDRYVKVAKDLYRRIQRERQRQYQLERSPPSKGIDLEL